MKNFVNENADFVATCAFSVPERRDLRFGSVHPKNRFLSLSLSLPSCGGVPAVADGTHPFGVSRSTRAECIFFRDDNYERNLLFRSPPLRFSPSFYLSGPCIVPRWNRIVSKETSFCCSFSGLG